jgi:hypothetical protein
MIDMGRNIVPRNNQDADLGTALKNWNNVYTDKLTLRGSDLQALLDGKLDVDILTMKGDLYVATGTGAITRLPRGNDGEILKVNSGTTEGLQWAPGGAKTELASPITVTVGTGGDYATINEALAALVALYYPIYISTGSVPQATVHLLSGFTMAEQVLVSGINLSWITISGDDAETTIIRSALTRGFVGSYPAFGASYGGSLPIIGQLFNMDASGSASIRNGIITYGAGSSANILPGKGVKNAGAIGIQASLGSTINASGANASGAGTYGIDAYMGATVNANGANVSDAGASGIHALSGAIINASGANASGAGTYGIIALSGAIINASGANASGAGIHGIFADYGSTINASGADASGAGDYGIFASRGSTINASDADASVAGTYGIYIVSGSIINAANATGTTSTAPNTLTSRGVIFQ